MADELELIATHQKVPVERTLTGEQRQIYAWLSKRSPVLEVRLGKRKREDVEQAFRACAALLDSAPTLTFKPDAADSSILFVEMSGYTPAAGLPRTAKHCAYPGCDVRGQRMATKLYKGQEVPICNTHRSAPGVTEIPKVDKNAIARQYGYAMHAHAVRAAKAAGVTDPAKLQTWMENHRGNWRAA
jgi:hypothetical protein